MKWRTRAGELINLKDMTDSHLNNAIRFLERKIEEYPGFHHYIGNSAFVEDAVDRENEENEDHLVACHEMLGALKSQQSARKLREKN